MGCSADLRRAHRARSADRPVDLLRPVARRPSARQVRDEQLKIDITRVHEANFAVYRVRKVWLQLNREGIVVARCTVARLMRALGLRGVTRGTVKRTTISDPAADRPADLAGRNFHPPAPNRLWVADLTYVSTWSGWVYVAFVVDAYARRILGWRTATTMTTSTVLDALEQAIWTRRREGHTDLSGLIHHNDRGSQYTSIRFGETTRRSRHCTLGRLRRRQLRQRPRETINGLYKTELIKRGKPWRTVEEVELATAEWIDWFNRRVESGSRLARSAADWPRCSSGSLLVRTAALGSACGLRPGECRNAVSGSREVCSARRRFALPRAHFPFSSMGALG